MINFEKMTPEELKDFLKSQDLKVLDVKELAKLLAIVQGYKAFFAPQRGINAFVEKTYWAAVEKEINKEFQCRNCKVTVLGVAEIFSEMNKLLLKGDIHLAQQFGKIMSDYPPDVIAQIKQELMEDPDYHSKYAEVIALFDKYISSLS